MLAREQLSFLNFVDIFRLLIVLRENVVQFHVSILNDKFAQYLRSQHWNWVNGKSTINSVAGSMSGFVPLETSIPKKENADASIPFNSASAIGICFGDSTRAACFRRRAAAEFREARIQDAHARGKRIGKREKETVRLHRSTAVETLPRPSSPFPA